jgi:phospholipid/cholesterol/gamma-HCH transport system substrate-binding protein
LENKTNYTMVGIIVLLLSAALVSSLIWLSIGFDSKQYNEYIVYISESVHGLVDDSPVKFNGVKVGMISKVELDKRNPQKIKLLLKIDKGITITTSTRATLITQGITGTTFLGLKASSPTLTPLQKNGVDPYPVIPYSKSFFATIEDNFTSISSSLKRVFDKENAQHIKESLNSLKHILDTVSKNDQNINKTLERLPQAMLELKTSINEFTLMSKHLSKASEQFSKTMLAGKEGVDQITQQTLPSVTTLVRRLDIIAANLEDVSAMMKQNPAVVIRGTTPPPPGPGE